MIGAAENELRSPVACRMRCCTMPSSISRICCKCSDRSVRNTTTLSMRFMNSGENLRRAASTAVRDLLARACRPSARRPGRSPVGPLMEFIHLAGAQVAGHEDQAREKSTRRLSPRVSVALSRMPSSRFHSASLAFSISSNSTKLSLRFSRVVLVEHFLAQQRMGLAMAQVSGRRANQLGDFVAVLELGAIDFDHARRRPTRLSAVASTMRVLPDPVGPRNRKLPIGRPGGFMPGEKHLVNFGDFFDGLVLADDFAPKSGFEILRRITAPRRIEGCVESGFHSIATYRLRSLTGTKGLRVAFMRWMTIAQSCFYCVRPRLPNRSCAYHRTIRCRSQRAGQLTHE